MTSVNDDQGSVLLDQYPIRQRTGVDLHRLTDGARLGGIFALVELEQTGLRYSGQIAVKPAEGSGIGQLLPFGLEHLPRRSDIPFRKGMPGRWSYGV